MNSPKIGTVQTIQVGTPQRYPLATSRDDRERFWKTSFFRQPDRESERRWLFTTHLDGNAQADRKNHGSLNQAVLLYAAAHYPVWRDELALPEIGPGGFAENFTIAGITEETACIGDVYGLGEARLQVTGPRYPCTKISRRWGIPKLTQRVAETGRTGWYCRVLAEGWVAPGLPLTLIERPYPRFTIALVNDFAHDRNHDLATAQDLAACPLLEDWWQELVVNRAMRNGS